MIVLIITMIISQNIVLPRDQVFFVQFLLIDITHINPFVPNAPFPYPLKTSECCFSNVFREEIIGALVTNGLSKFLSTFQFFFSMLLTNFLRKATQNLVNYIQIYKKEKNRKEYLTQQFDKPNSCSKNSREVSLF